MARIADAFRSPGKELSVTLLNSKHEAVAVAFLADPEKIGWRAYRSVYQKASRHACENGFTRMMKNEEFSARVAELKEAAASCAVMTAQRTLERLTECGEREWDQLTLKAVELIGKHHELFTDKIKHDHSNIAERLAAADERMRRYEESGQADRPARRRNPRALPNTKPRPPKRARPGRS
jgi:predicted nucleic acid-binding protein